MQDINFTPFQELIYKRTYSRYMDKEGRRERWAETVKRYFEYMSKYVPDEKKAEFDAISESTYLLDVMPSMRALWTAGKALDREHICGYNCAALIIDSPRAFAEMLYILMCGGGVGFSVERQFVAKLPAVPKEIEHSESEIVFADSKLGWAEGFNRFVNGLYNGVCYQCNLTKIRPKGKRLKVFGGRASGPEPLRRLIEYTKFVFNNAQGRQLSSIECHDICCYIASIVVVGGVRRSASISLSNLSDDRMRTAKNGEFWRTNPQRALANNAVCYTEKPEPDRFLEEWLNLMRSGSGERGIFNREGTKNFVKAKNRDHNHNFLVNPCVPFNTRILTDGGYVKIGEVVGQEINVWNGYEFSKTMPYRTGTKPIFRVDLSDGTSFFCTPNHEFILWDGYSQRGKEYRLRAEELEGGEKLAKFDLPVVKGGNDYFVDAYSQGFYSGDGNKDLAYSWLYETKYCCEGRLVGEFKECGTECGTERNCKTWKHGEMLDRNFVPINGTIKYCLNWLAGLCDADGTVTRDKSGNGIQISSINRGFLMDVKLMLSRMGVSAVVCGGRDAGNRSLPDGNGGNCEYYCKQDFRLLIGNMETKRLLDIGFKTERLSLYDGAPQRSAKRFVRVVSVEDTGRVEDVFCFTEPKNHSGTFEGVVTGQCGEVVLRPKQFCNLTEVVVRDHDTFESLKKKVQEATIMGCIQSTLTDFGFLSADWKKNCEEERLLGVSLTGLRDHKILSRVGTTARLWLTCLNEIAHTTAKEWAKALGINTPAAICCVKPSGCRTGDSLLTTNDGIFCLDELKYGENAGDWVNVEGLNSTSGAITKTYNNGVSLVYSIDCNFGMKLKSTANHKWMVHGKGWTRTDEIKEGDQLVYSFSEYAGLDQRLNKPDVSDLYCNCNFEVRLPDYVSTDLGWLLGYIWGNGSMSDDKSRFRFTDANKACLKKANIVFSELFGISGSILNKPGEAAFTLEIASRKLWRFFEINGMVKNLERLPLVLRRSSKDSIIAFLAGMIDADGHAATKQVTFSTTNDGLSEHFQNVALTLGLVFSRSKNVARKNSFSKKHMWLMTLSWGQSTENKIILKNNSVIMKDWVPPKLNSRSSAYRLCVVKDVASHGSEQTYDVETSSHWFWAGAVMSHNTVSLLVDSASGMHPRFSKYYIRRVRVACVDPLCRLLKDQGVSWRPENGETEEKHQTAVFEFPIKAPEGAATTEQVSAIGQLEYWKMLKEHWCDHNPSVTIYVGEGEWVSVGAWVYDNWDFVGGITFLPRDNQVYQLAPYEAISESEYERLAAEMPDIDYEALVNYENEDQTEGSREFACSGNACELV